MASDAKKPKKQPKPEWVVNFGEARAQAAERERERNQNDLMTSAWKQDARNRTLAERV